jgi:trk system potassium uptake protein TrkA
MRYVIVGCGRVGSTLAKLLVAEAHDVTVVDENPAAFKRLGVDFPGRVEVGTGIDYDVLKRAGSEGADGFVAVTDGDNRNVMAALIAQRLFNIPRIVARIYDPPRGQLYRELGIETVCPTTIGAKMIRDRLANTPIDSNPSFDFGKVSSLALTLGEAQHGKRVAELEQDGQIRIAAVRRIGMGVEVPRGDFVLHRGDEVNFIVGPEVFGEFCARFATPPPGAPAISPAVV